MPTQPSSVAADPPIDCFRYRIDPDIDHFVAQIADGERIVASLRLEPMRSAPIHTLHRVGAITLPRTDGAYAHLDAEAGASGDAGLAMATAAAWLIRHEGADDAFWLTGCPNALVGRALALGWRAVPAQHSVAVPGRTTLVLLLDDRAHFTAIGSPLAAMSSAQMGERVARLNELLDGFDMQKAVEPLRAAG
jgi:hypothetical protein